MRPRGDTPGRAGERFCFGDLSIESDLPLPEIPISSRPPTWSVRVLESTSEPLSPGEPSGWTHAWRLSDGRSSIEVEGRGSRYRVSLPGVAAFTIDVERRAVRCFPEPGTPVATLRHLLLDQVLPRLLTLEGRLVLHAGAVLVGAGACAFLGESGRGKSTLCASFARAGIPLLGDDALMVRGKPAGAFEVLPTYAGLRLLPDARRRLFGDDAPTFPVAHYTEKRRMRGDRTAMAPAVSPAPLAALFVLASPADCAGATRVGRTRLSAREALVELVRCSFQLDVADSARTRDLFERLGDLAGAVPAHRLVIPRDFACLPAAREAILASVQRS
jgi:hypothetical protein